MRCPFCNSENPDDAKYCGNCGEELSKKNNVISKKKFWLTVISAAAIIIIVAAFIIVKGNGNVLSGNSNGDVELSDFKADETYFAAGQEDNITFTVSVQGNPGKVSLIRDNEAVAEMLDNGEDSDVVANDGIYTASVVCSEDNAAQFEYSCTADGAKSENISVYVFDEPTEENWNEISETESTVQDIESDYLDEDGYVPLDSVPDVISKVSEYAKDLYDKGVLIYYETNDTNVLFKFVSGLAMIYEPDTGKTDSGGEGVDMTVLTCQPCLSGYDQSLSEYMKLPDQAADTVRGTFDNYSYSDETNYDDDEVTLSLIKSFASNQIVLWHGHGGYSSSLHSYLLTGDDYSVWRVQDWADYIQNRIVDFSGQACITSKFIDKHCENLDNSLIYLAACSSGKDSALADTFLNKRSAAVVGNTHTLLTVYNLLVQNSTMTHMTQVNDETENYYTLNEALKAAKEDYGDSDADYSPDGKDAYAIIFGGADAEGYRLGEYTPEDNKPNESKSGSTKENNTEVNSVIELTDYYGNIDGFIAAAGLSDKSDEYTYKYASDKTEISVLDPNTKTEFSCSNTDKGISAYGVKIGDDKESAVKSISKYGIYIETDESTIQESDTEIYLWDDKSEYGVVAIDLDFDDSGKVESWFVINWPQGEFVSWYVGFLTDAHDQGVTELADWQKAYANYLFTDYFYDNYGNNLYECTLVYINDDDIPELYIDYGSTAGGSKLLYYNGTEVVSQTMYTFGLQYYEKKNLFLDYGGHMDEYYDTVYTIRDGGFAEVASGTYGAEDNSNVQFDENGKPIYKYYWNGNETSESEYINSLNKAFDTNSAKQPFGDYNSETGMYDGAYSPWDICKEILKIG